MHAQHRLSAADQQAAVCVEHGYVHTPVLTQCVPACCHAVRVLYKLDRTGAGEELSLTDLPNCPGLPLSGWTADQFLQLCVMAGCDFLAQLPGIGLKKAHGVLRKYRSFTKVGVCNSVPPALHMHTHPFLCPCNR